MKYLACVLLSLGIYCATRAMAFDKPFKGVSLFVQLNKKIFDRSDPFFVEVVVSNKSSEIVKLWESIPERDFEIEVKTSKGAIVPRTAYGQKLRDMRQAYKTILITLKKDETYTRRLEIGKVFELSRPGDYSIKVKRAIQDDMGKRYSTLTSSIVTFSIRE